MSINETHDPDLESWVATANSPQTDFPIQNLPFCVFRHGHSAPRVGVGIGDSILEVPDVPSLNDLASQGRAGSSELRLKLSRALRADNPYPPKALLFPMAECSFDLPLQIGDYTDFYASIFHATNIGSMFRPDNPLLPNYKYLPIGYHGRASSVIISGSPVRRPSGQLQDGDAPPVFAPSRQLDYESELGVFIGQGNTLGEPIDIANAEDHMFGICLVNDWSARDVQRWEYQPLGPFLAKSFATTISPWVVTLEALAPFRAPWLRPAAEPAPLAYLDDPHTRAAGALDIRLEAWLQSARMRAAGLPPQRLSHATFRDAWWTVAHMLTHHTVNGCNLRPGDLFGSGTQSGPQADEAGSLLELSSGGRQPLALAGERCARAGPVPAVGTASALLQSAEREQLRRLAARCRGS